MIYEQYRLAIPSNKEYSIAQTLPSRSGSNSDAENITTVPPSFY